jgi:DNA replication and repair protein RecF
MVPLAINSLSVRAFRNLSSVDLELGPRFNVLSGDNGQGKTNLLEAVYVLATSRSFRTAKLAELIESGRETASVRATLREGTTEREQSVGLRIGTRAVRIDGKRPSTLAGYAIRTPTVAFHPGVVALSAGSGADRRKLLDRVALYLRPGSLADAASYARALRARQRVLETRGAAAADLDEWEALIVLHGAAMRESREEAARRLGPSAERAFASIGPSGLALGVSYAPNAPAQPAEFRALLARNRGRDRARGASSSGPHRDELALALGGRPMRGMASQGQHRAAVLALELAEIDVIGEASGVRPLLLLDDVSSELDRTRTAALFACLSSHRGQVLLTTTRPELIETGSLSSVDERVDFRVVGGEVRPA